MAKREEFSGLGFARTYVLPVLLIAVVPLFSLWFFRHIEASYDQDIVKALGEQVRKDPSITAQRRTKILDYFQKLPPSKIVATTDAEHEKLREMFSSSASSFAWFRWFINMSRISLVLALLAFVGGGVAVLLSLRSQVVQYWSLTAGWHLLKIVSALQVLLQGGLAIGLSYWVTAFMAERIYLKLIAAIAILAGGAMLAVLGAIFKQLDPKFPLNGKLLDPECSRTLRERIGQMAATLSIPPPDHIVVGIDDNFFVTEHPVTLEGKELQGRTLFISLPLLKILEKEEAAAVLAHELAHFSGQDTLYSRKISPVLGRYGVYLEALHENGFAFPVFAFMLFFRSLFELSLRKTGREREFRADATAARLTSPQAVSNALLKTCAYSRYRADLEAKLFGQETVLGEARIGAGVAEGFPAFVSKGLSLDELGDDGTTHPFDTHPPLAQRMKAVGVTLETGQREAVLLTGVEYSWNREIDGADEIEGAQWAAYEDAFRKAHEQSLAYRYLPATDEERALVEKFFPAQQLASGAPRPILLDHATVHHPDWPEPVVLAAISECKVEESSGSNYLKITHLPAGSAKPAKLSLNVSGLPDGGGGFLEAFGYYYGRAQAAKEYQSKRTNTGATPG